MASLTSVTLIDSVFRHGDIQRGVAALEVQHRIGLEVEIAVERLEQRRINPGKSHGIAALPAMPT
jgi:hypothetical protein